MKISIPENFLILRSDVGIVVSIAAFQAVDPGSIPGHRKIVFAYAQKGTGKKFHINLQDFACGSGFCDQFLTLMS